MKTPAEYWQMASRLAVLGLIVIAAFVFAGLLLQQNMWIHIIFYWLVLTLKNFFDYKALKATNTN